MGYNFIGATDCSRPIAATKEMRWGGYGQ